MLYTSNLLVGNGLENDHTDQATSTEDDNMTAVEEQHGEDKSLNTPVNVVEDAKQTHPHHEEDISDNEDVINHPDYTPSCDELSVPEYEDSLSMVATTPEWHNKEEDVDWNNMVKRKKK